MRRGYSLYSQMTHEEGTSHESAPMSPTGLFSLTPLADDVITSIVSVRKRTILDKKTCWQLGARYSGLDVRIGMVCFYDTPEAQKPFSHLWAYRTMLSLRRVVHSWKFSPVSNNSLATSKIQSVICNPCLKQLIAFLEIQQSIYKVREAFQCDRARA